MSKAVKHCSKCSCELVWYVGEDTFTASSANIDDWDICVECMIEHCCSTNCLSCSYGKYPDCQFLEIKTHYKIE